MSNGGQPSGGTGIGSGQTPSGGVDDLSAYLKQLHQAQIAEQLARLKSAYDQNTADLRAQGDRLGLQFDAARNSAAAQGDLSRLSLNEFGAARGLNTGTTGQMALAQNVALQTGLAGIGAQEAQAKSDNDLAISKLGLEYNNAVNQAKAAGDVELAKSLYQEYVRQADQLSQQNWIQNFQYGQSTDGRDYAANLAKVMLDNGVMPDSATLSAAGISQDATNAWRNQAMLLLNAKLYGSASSGSGSSKKSSGGGSSSSGTSSSGTSYTPSTAARTESASSSSGLKGKATRESALTSMDFSPDEGVIIWNGKRYKDKESFLFAVNSAGLTAGQEQTILRKLKRLGVKDYQSDN